MAGRRFSTHHGNNISLNLSRCKASWKAGPSLSWVFCERPLVAGRTVDVICSGGGCCAFGLVQIDPNDAKQGRTLIAERTPYFTEIKFRTRKCVVQYQLALKGNKVIATCEQTSYNEPVRKGSDVWISVCIKYGTAAITILESGKPSIPQPFSPTHGPNVNLSPDRLSARLTNHSPAAVCFLQGALQLQETVCVSCKPILADKREPGRYQVGIYVCKKKPDVASSVIDKRSLLTGGVILENEDCKGVVKIGLVTDDSGTGGSVGIVIVTATGREIGRPVVLKTADKAWLVFEPYKASVKVIETTHAIGHRNILQFAPREPRNEFAENSFEMFSGQRSRDDNVVDEPSAIASKPVLSSISSETIPKHVSWMPSPETVPKRVYSLDSIDNPDDGRTIVPPDTNRGGVVTTAKDKKVKTSNVPEQPGNNVNQAMLVDRLKVLENEMKSLKKVPEVSMNPSAPTGRRTRLAEHTRNNYTVLLRSMQPHLLSDFLFERGLICDAERAIILATRDLRAASRYIIELLCKKDADETILVNTLKDAEMDHLIPLFLGPTM